MNEPGKPPSAPRYRWPWMVLALFVLGVVLAIVWMWAEVRRTRNERDPQGPAFPESTGTNSAAPR